MSTLELETVLCSSDGGVGRITLNRPDALNAWIRRLGDDMLAALEHHAADRDVRVIVFTGAGRAFSAGADLKASGELTTDDGAFDVLTPLRESYNPLLLRVRTVDKPVIAAVNGAAAGIGCSLALAADMVVAARSAYFLLAFVNVGLGLDGGASQLLRERIGHARAFEMAYLGERVSAEQALDWGMINRVVDDGELPAAVDELAARFVAGPPGSYATIKHTINARAYADFAELLELEAVQQQRRIESRDFLEGVAAFVEKRPARFTGD
ncbi:MAG TPA: enoyl-CoA hydratase-related protein [Solirubrobacteraceae bacterium]|nr:enoyl-CoA hydratase-related protein [Solirubrobacteraceae bacterium]